MPTILRSVALVLAAFWACFPLTAAAEVPPSAEGAAEAARPALWKIADEDTTIYLFGTIHVLPPDIPWFGGKVSSALQASDTLVTEIADADPLEMQALVMDKAVLPETQTLRALLSEKDRAAYEEGMRHLGLPLAAFDRFEPWYAAMGLAMLPLLQEGFATEHGVEKRLQQEAQERGLSHEALETHEYQLGLFDMLPLRVQKRYLAEVIEQLPTFRQDLTAMIDAWKSGDAETLAGLMNAEQSDPVLVETLLTSRNKAWAAWVAERLEEPGTVFLAIGAGHLAGPGSLQDELLVRGIDSQRIQ